MSYDKDALHRLYEAMMSLRNSLGWRSKKKLDTALMEWQHEDRLFYSRLKEAMLELYNIERI